MVVVGIVLLFDDKMFFGGLKFVCFLYCKNKDVYFLMLFNLWLVFYFDGF